MASESTSIPPLFGVCGAGTMGSGIAYAAALAGYRVVLYDINEAAVTRGAHQIGRYLQGSVERGKLDPEEAKEIRARVTTTASLEEFAGCEIAVEADHHQRIRGARSASPDGRRARPSSRRAR